jgi:hypothetical protein
MGCAIRVFVVLVVLLIKQMRRLVYRSRPMPESRVVSFLEDLSPACGWQPTIPPPEKPGSA